MNQLYQVEVTITNKMQARDPEGETIIRDLIHKKGLNYIKEVHTGKLLTLKLEAESQEDARNLTFSACNDLRLYNPVAHSISIRVEHA
ncbi:MAG TPA: phosphoribosylformylglycinamidine synthase subunit PurS [Candidatus Acidoferrum sp.]|nr:phosphoribosylformylglycinamidine synthase subunit PurS [Candidatus Acidoferrum sp.]